MVPGAAAEEPDYLEQLKQMLKDLGREREKDVEKPVPLMNQVRDHLASCHISRLSDAE